MVNLATFSIVAVASRTKCCAAWTCRPTRRHWVGQAIHTKKVTNRRGREEHPGYVKLRSGELYVSPFEEDDLNDADENQVGLSSSSPSEMEQWKQELFQAEKRAEDRASLYNSQSLGQAELPDLIPFQRQVQKNAGGDKESLPASLSIPEFNSEAGKEIAEKANGAVNRFEGLSFPTIPEELATTDQTQIEDEDSNGFYLAPDIYQRSRDLLHSDGSLDLEQTTANSDPNTPDGRQEMLERLLQSELESNSSPQQSAPQQEEDWNEIWATIQTAQATAFNASQSEELHKQVFENEQGYLQQTEKFRQSLTDPTVAEEATYERRSAQFLDRQAKALEELNRNMQEFEQELLRRKRPGPTTCSRCSCKLVEADYDISPQLWMRNRNLTRLCQTCYMDMMETARNFQKLQPKGADKDQERDPPLKKNGTQASEPSQTAKDAAEDVDSWNVVEDPDTGETFYWNAENDEIKWEL